MIRLKLSEAQISALECRDGGGLDPLTLAAWRGDVLEFDAADAEALADELGEASNGEGEQREIYGDVLAGRAARSLCALSSKVLRCAPRYAQGVR